MGTHNLRHITAITFYDGSGTPLSCSLGPGPKDLQISDVEEGFMAALDVMDGGDFHDRVYGEAQPVNGSLTVIQDAAFTDAGTGRPMDAALKTGAFASTGTTVDPGGLVWAGDIIVTLSRAGVSGTITFYNCRMKASFSADLNGNKMALSWSARGRNGNAPMVAA